MSKGMAKMRELEITIPGELPRELAPNYLRAWQGTRNKKIAEVKWAAYFYAVDARNTWERQHDNKPWLPLEKAELEVVLIAPHNPRYDWDNLVSMLKHYVDMLTLERPGKPGAGILKDDKRDCLTWRSIDWFPGVHAIRLIIWEVM